MYLCQSHNPLTPSPSPTRGEGSKKEAVSHQGRGEQEGSGMEVIFQVCFGSFFMGLFPFSMKQKRSILCPPPWNKKRSILWSPPWNKKQSIRWLPPFEGGREGDLIGGRKGDLIGGNEGGGRRG